MKFVKSKRIFRLISFLLVFEFYFFLVLIGFLFSTTEKEVLQSFGFFVGITFYLMAFTFGFRYIFALIFSRCTNCNKFLSLTFGGECSSCSYYNLPMDQNGGFFSKNKQLQTSTMENERFILTPEGDLINKKPDSFLKLDRLESFLNQIAFNLIYGFIFIQNYRIVLSLEGTNIELRHNHHFLSFILGIAVVLIANFIFFKLESKKYLYLIEIVLIILIASYSAWGLGITEFHSH